MGAGWAGRGRRRPAFVGVGGGAAPWGVSPWSSARDRAPWARPVRERERIEALRTSIRSLEVERSGRRRQGGEFGAPRSIPPMATGCRPAWPGMSAYAVGCVHVAHRGLPWTEISAPTPRLSACRLSGRARLSLMPRCGVRSVRTPERVEASVDGLEGGRFCVEWRISVPGVPKFTTRVIAAARFASGARAAKPLVASKPELPRPPGTGAGKSYKSTEAQVLA